MSKLRPAAGLLLAAAAGVFVARWDWAGDAADGMAANTTVARSEASAAVPVPAARVVHFWSEPVANNVATVSNRPAMTLEADAAAQVAEEAALQLMAKDADLELSPRQWRALAAVTAHIQAVRQAYEASIAMVTVTPNGRRLEIPAYAAAGDALRAKFQAGLREELGAETAGEVLAQMGKALEGHFGGFGVSVQTLEFSATSRPGQNDYQVTRTVRFWNSVEGSERLTTRRETHFPGIEDPSGQAWGAFLAVLGGGGAGE